MVRALRPSRDPCVGQELNLNYASLLQDCMCRTEEVDQGGGRNSVIKRQEFVPGPLRGERAEAPEGVRRQSPRVSVHPEQLLEPLWGS